jgi:hypothetical protein
MNTEAGALRAFQQSSSLAYHCPFGHGLLTAIEDELTSTGLALICPACGHRVGVDTAILGSALAHSAISTLTDATADAPVRLPDGGTPRGLRADGTVRTTGWVQLAKIPISSGLWAVLLGFLVGIMLVPALPWLPFAGALGGYLFWKLHTTKLRPASKAVNTRKSTAREVVAGELIRLYGTAGPVGRVAAIAADAEGRVRLRLAGGHEFMRAPTQRMWRVDLRN